MRFLNSKYSGIIFVLILAVAIFGYCWQADKVLIKHHLLSVAKINKVSYRHIGQVYLIYTFSTNKKIESGAQVFGNNILSFKDAKYYLVGKTFPVVYNPNDPGNHYLLLREREFNEFNIPFPDSLLWLKKYIKQ